MGFSLYLPADRVRR